MTIVSGHLHARRPHEPVLSRLAHTDMAEHLPSPTSPERLTLCQEYAMRTGGYDDRALVSVAFEDGHWRPSVTFASLVDEHGVEGAILAVRRCSWLSRDDFTSIGPIPCTECAEVRSA